jgi:hypothetical protein
MLPNDEWNILLASISGYLRPSAAKGIHWLRLAPIPSMGAVYRTHRSIYYLANSQCTLKAVRSKSFFKERLIHPSGLPHYGPVRPENQLI